MLHTIATAVSLAFVLLAAAPATATQDEATTERVAAGECIAPALPPGAVTAPDEAADVADAGDAAAAAPTPMPEGVPADQATVERFVAAETNLINCANAGDYEAAAALFSPAGLEFFFGSANPYDAAANLAGYPRMALQSVDNVENLADGRIRGEITYTVGAQLVGDVEYWVDQGGVLLLDAFAPLPEPLTAPADAPMLTVEMIDYAFALSDYTIPAAKTIVFRTNINSESASDHVATLVSCPNGTTVEQLITGEVAYATACPDSFGQQYLRPGQEFADMILLGIEPGTYFLLCDVPTPSGHVHQALGMVAKVTVT